MQDGTGLLTGDWDAARQALQIGDLLGNAAGGFTQAYRLTRQFGPNWAACAGSTGTRGQALWSGLKSLTPEVAGATVGGTTAALTGKDWLAGAQYGMMVYGMFAAVYRAQSVKPCFPGETQVETATGFQRIDELREGDWVWSRNEFDPHGPLDLKRVEEVFIRHGRIWHLHVGDRVIRVTPEHPVYVQDQGWTAVGELQVGDILRTKTGWLPVEDLLVTGEYETVYNLRVADWHTYFVGGVEWGFSVWAHNACTGQHVQDALEAEGLGKTNVKTAGKLAELANNNNRQQVVSELQRLRPDATPAQVNRMADTLMGQAGHGAGPAVGFRKVNQGDLDSVVDQATQIGKAQQKIRQGKLEGRIIDSDEKSQQRLRNRLRDIRSLDDLDD